MNVVKCVTANSMGIENPTSQGISTATNFPGTVFASSFAFCLVNC